MFLTRNEILPHFNIDLLTPFKDDKEQSDSLDIKRDYDIRTANEFIMQMRQQFFQEIMNLKPKQREDQEKSLKLKPQTQLNEIYSFNQLKSISLRLVDSIRLKPLVQPKDYKVKEEEIVKLNTLIDLIIKSRNNRIQMSFEGFFLFLMNLHGCMQIRSIENTGNRSIYKGQFLLKYFETQPEDQKIKHRISRLVKLFFDMYENSNQKVVERRYLWQQDLKMQLHKIIHQREIQIFQAHTGKAILDTNNINFYQDFLKYPELVTSTFNKNIYSLNFQGYNVIMILEVIMEVLELLVKNKYNVNSEISLKDLEKSNNSFLLNPNNYK